MQQPTYTKEEALKMMGILDYEGLILLGRLIDEEKKRYSLADLKVLVDVHRAIVGITRMSKGI